MPMLLARKAADPSYFCTGGKTGNKFLHGITSLVPGSIKAVVRSAIANYRLQNSTPVFYFFFENKGAGLNNTGGTFPGFMNSASSPNEFVLVRMNVSTDEREVIIGKSSTPPARRTKVALANCSNSALIAEL